MVYESSARLLARPGQPLKDHLNGVQENASRLVPEDATVGENVSLQTVATTIAKLHDIGKLTQWFQEYIHKGDTNSRSSLYKRHSLVSAYLTFHALGQMEVSNDVQLAGFYAVAKHHGVLPNFEDQHSRYSLPAGVDRSERIERIGEQLQNIDAHVSDIADAILNDATNGQLRWDDVLVEESTRYAQALPRSFDPDTPSEFYPLVLRLWSTLTSADKLDAAGLAVSDGNPEIPDWRRIQEHLENDSEGIQSTLNEHRTRARHQATEQMERLSGTESVFTLTLPTGFGKTLAGLETALREAERTDGRVIYALPFTTVIDQVHDEVTEKLEVTPERDRYTLHHHLADTRTKVSDESESVSDGSEVLYGESWQAGLVLTTFVQLFESLAGPGNTQSIKLPALQDSVIVVDEPQAVTKEWWYLISRLTTILVEEYDATVILMTATQPGIIAETNPQFDPTELIPNPDTYFDFLRAHQRVRFEIDDSVQDHLQTGTQDGINVDDAVRRVHRAIQSDGIDSALVVSNTVRAASAIYRATVETIDQVDEEPVSLGESVAAFTLETDNDVLDAVNQGDEQLDRLVEAFFETTADRLSGDEILVGALSTAIRPVDRAFLIEIIRRLIDDESDTPLDDHRVIVSSTQLVEAGVDVSFDRLYRDYAPIPSLVQAAGRCNRSFGGDTATVTLWRLGGIDVYPPPSSIYRYDRNLLKPTAYALESLLGTHGKTIPEHVMVSDGVQQYYERLHEDEQRSVESDTLASAVDRARGETLREASLIDDDSEEALVVTDTSTAALLQQYIEGRARGSYYDASEAFDMLKYISASIREDVRDDLDQFVRKETAVDPGELDLSEITLVDARESDEYDLHDGSGVRGLD